MVCDPSTLKFLKRTALISELIGITVFVGTTSWIANTGIDGTPTKILFGIAGVFGGVGGALSKWCDTQGPSDGTIPNA